MLTLQLNLDPVAAIRDYNTGRDPERLALKYAKMRANPFVFLRGACHLFHERLPDAPFLCEAPTAWNCGDLHLENFGGYKGNDRQVCFDINDFDEAALAPCALDLLHFLVSLRLAAPTIDLSGQQAEKLSTVFLTAYSTALATDTCTAFNEDNSRGLMRKLLADLEERERPRFLDTRSERSDGRRHLRIDGKKALPASKAQQQEVAAFMESYAALQEKPSFFRLIDVARRIAGTGSLGLERYILLVEGRGSPDGNFLLDLKRTAPASLTGHFDHVQPAWPDESVRAVSIQKRLQATPPAFLQAVTLSGQGAVLRDLQASEDRISLANAKDKTLAHLLEDLGTITAAAHQRGAGWQGAANLSDLRHFGEHSDDWQPAILGASLACAEQICCDWRHFAAAVDAGELRA